MSLTVKFRRYAFVIGAMLVMVSSNNLGMEFVHALAVAALTFCASLWAEQGKP